MSGNLLAGIGKRKTYSFSYFKLDHI